MPARVVFRSRTYMASYLLNMPILGTCIKAMGHFAVAFKGKEDGDFSVCVCARARVSATHLIIQT